MNDLKYYSDLVLSHVENYSGSKTITAKKSYIVETELSNLSKTNGEVYIVPIDETRALASRVSYQRDQQVSVAIAARLETPLDNDNIESWISYAQELADDIASNLSVKPIAMGFEPLFSVEDMRQSKLFYSELRLTFRSV